MTAAPLHWFRHLTLVHGPNSPASRGDAIVSGDGQLIATGEDASRRAAAEGLPALDGSTWWLAPTLVDPHSVLEQPLLGRAETLTSLATAAATGGYGQVALLPWGNPPRDQPERLQLHWPEPLQLHQWAALCSGEGEQDLSPQRELLNAGAIGLAAGAELPALNLLQRSLQLGEMGSSPVLVAPRQRSLAGDGLVRERVEALRAGWPVDPPCSETLPLGSLLQLQQNHPERRLVAMNVSTAEAVERLGQACHRPLATVHWWALLHDSGSLPPTSSGWRLEPPLGGPHDRGALRQALAQGWITAVAVHHQALDAEEQLLPIDQRRIGLAGHGLVLPLLAQALVAEAGWTIEQLWQVLCWGPSSVLGLAPETLSPGSRRWLLFDPNQSWNWPGEGAGSQAANQPLLPGSTVTGRIRASGLIGSERWQLSAAEGRS